MSLLAMDTSLALQNLSGSDSSPCGSNEPHNDDDVAGFDPLDEEEYDEYWQWKIVWTLNIDLWLNLIYHEIHDIHIVFDLSILNFNLAFKLLSL